MGSSFNGNTGKNRGKIKSVWQTGQGNKTSFKVEPSPYSEQKALGGMPERVVENPSPLLFRRQDPDTPNQQYNRDSQQARYERAIYNTFIARIDEKPYDEIRLVGETEYFFVTNNSPDNFWKVVRTVRNVNIKFLRTLTIFGGAIYQLIGDENTERGEAIYPELPEGEERAIDLSSNWIPDEDEFEWKQISGFRQIFFSDNTALPKLVLPSSASGGGAIERSKPIIVKATPVGDELLFDELLIYTIPTSFFTGTGIVGGYGDNPDYWIGKLTFFPRQLDPSIANTYWWRTPNASDRQWVYWQLPIRDREKITRTYWTINTTGTYLPDVTHVFPNRRVVSLSGGTRYRPLTEWEYGGSEPYRHYSPDVVIEAPSDSLSYGFIEEPFSPLDSYSNTSSSQTLDLSNRRIDLEDTIDSLSLSPHTGSITSLDVSQRRLTFSDTLVRSFVRARREGVDGSIRVGIQPAAIFASARKAVDGSVRVGVDGSIRGTFTATTERSIRVTLGTVVFGNASGDNPRYQNFGVMVFSGQKYEYIDLLPNVIG
jgi:hypothetical protein